LQAWRSIMLPQTSACSRFIAPLGALAFVACAGSSARPADAPTTSITTTTGAAIDGSGKPATAAPPISAAPLSPLDGACSEGEPRGGLTDRVSCLESCRGFDDTAPMGSQCPSQYADCSMKCEAWFLRGP
jgi:hypothetical protein